MPTDPDRDATLAKSAKAGFAFAAAVAFVGMIDVYDEGLPSGADYLLIALGVALYYGGVLRGVGPLRVAGWGVAIAGIVVGLYGAAT